MQIDFTGERIVPGAANCEPTFAQKMYQEHVARYAFAAQLVEEKDVLDLACGVGYGSQWLAKARARSVLGIDIAEDAIEHARKNYFHPSVSYRVQDARWMDFEAQFDVITCFEFIEHVDEQAKVLDAIKRALRAQGTLIISTPRPLDNKRTHFHVHELEFEELRRMLAERFSRVEFFFERNCFTSFVGAAIPKELNGIVKVTDKLSLEDADYFVFVARSSEQAAAESTNPVLVVNDDSYVLTLEQDIANLRNGETYHNNLIKDLAQKSENLGEELSRARSDVEASLRRAEDFGAMQKQLAALLGEVASIREEVRVSVQLSAVQGELASAQGELASTQRELASTQGEFDALRRSHREVLEANDQLTADNERIRTVLAKVSQQLAETETQLNGKIAEADAADLLKSEMAVIQEARARELDALNEKYEQSERTLNRFRRSVSWKVTRPIRWVGRQYRQVSGGSVA